MHLQRSAKNRPQNARVTVKNKWFIVLQQTIKMFILLSLMIRLLTLSLSQAWTSCTACSTCRLTCLPWREKSFLTAPESSLTVSVMSVRTCSKERAVLRLSRTRTARRGRLPLRITVMSFGLTNWIVLSISLTPPVNVESLNFTFTSPEHGLPDPLLPLPLLPTPLALLRCGCGTLEVLWRPKFTGLSSAAGLWTRYNTIHMTYVYLLRQMAA